MGVKFHRIFVNTGQWRECIWVDAEGKEHRRDFERHSASISTPNKLKGPLRHGCSFFNAFSKRSANSAGTLESSGETDGDGESRTISV